VLADEAIGDSLHIPTNRWLLEGRFIPSKLWASEKFSREKI
jgi:hypothetical protein